MMDSAFWRFDRVFYSSIFFKKGDVKIFFYRKVSETKDQFMPKKEALFYQGSYFSVILMSYYPSRMLCNPLAERDTFILFDFWRSIHDT